MDRLSFEGAFRRGAPLAAGHGRRDGRWLWDADGDRDEDSHGGTCLNDRGARRDTTERCLLPGVGRRTCLQAEHDRCEPRVRVHERALEQLREGDRSRTRVVPDKRLRADVCTGKTGLVHSEDRTQPSQAVPRIPCLHPHQNRRRWDQIRRTPIPSCVCDRGNAAMLEAWLP
jgi:hypothetical protein